mgnify:FL=1
MKILNFSVQKSAIFSMIVPVFILNGLFFALLLPSFQNPDEAVHYSTVQHWAEPKIKDWQIKEEPKKLFDSSNISTLNFSEEITRAAQAVDFDEIKSSSQNTQDFSDKATESSINANTWSRWVDTTPSAVSGTQSWYYLVSSWIERWLADQDIFTRMLAIRLFSVLLGFMAVWLAYLTLLKIGFSRVESTLIAGLIAFQPMLGVTAAQINIDIALIFAFALFTYAGISLLRDSSTPPAFGEASLGITKNRIWMMRYGIIAILAAILGITAKGPGIVLVGAIVPLFSYVTWKRYIHRASFRMTTQKLFSAAAILIMIAGTVLVTAFPTYFESITRASAESQFDSPLALLAA